MKPTIDARDPFKVNINTKKKRDLADWLAREIEGAADARVSIIGQGGDIDYAHFLYEQGRTPPKLRRWPGAADLSSYIPTEKVDALRSRVMKTIRSEPFSIVEGWGADSQKAPFVEEFHEWKRRDERLFGYLSKTIHTALIEQNGILEVLDRSDVRLVRKLETFAAKMAEDGTVPLDEQQQPEIETDENGKPIVAQESEETATVKAATATYQHVRRGPGYRVISLRDFVFLPGHAADKADLYGMFKRVYLRVNQIEELIQTGVYDTDALEQINRTQDRDTIQPTLANQGMTLAQQQDGTEEKELWSGLLLYDCDGDGLHEWYYVTIHVPTRSILRLRHDDLGVPRFLNFCPFPKSDSVYGYSFVLDKLGTTAEEHTSLRNMIADRSTLATTPPIKRVVGALWDPAEQPWGTGQVIDVRDPNELTAFEINDVPVSALNREAAILQAAERLTGLNDQAVGVQTEERRTATEIQNVAVAGAVRTEEVVENIQEELELLDQVRNELWIRTLEAQPDEGMDAPESVSRSLQMKGLTLKDGKFTASMLRGNLRFKPHGSVETADKMRMRGDYNGWLSALAGLAKMNPLAAALLQQPGVIKAVIEQGLRLYNVPDKQPFMEGLKAAFEAMQKQAQEQPVVPAVVESLKYQNAPPDVQRQIEEKAGFRPSQMLMLPAPGDLPPGAEGEADAAAGESPQMDPVAELMQLIAAKNPQLAEMLQGGGMMRPGGGGMVQ